MGIEPVTIADIKKYKPRSSSITSGQVLARDYEHEEGRLIVKEMADGMCLQLVEQGMVTDSVTIYINYSKEYSAAAGVPQSVRGSIMLPSATSSSKRCFRLFQSFMMRLRIKIFLCVKSILYLTG